MIIDILYVISVFLDAHEVDTQLFLCSKAADMDQVTKGDVQNTGSPSVLETKRINRYPHLQPLDTCYDDLCDPYTYQVRTTVYCELSRPMFGRGANDLIKCLHRYEEWKQQG